MSLCSTACTPFSSPLFSLACFLVSVSVFVSISVSLPSRLIARYVFSVCASHTREQAEARVQDARKWRGPRHSGEFKKGAGFARPAILKKSATCPSVQLVNHSRSNGLTWLEMTYLSNNTVKDCQKGKRRANDAQRPCEKHRRRNRFV